MKFLEFFQSAGENSSKRLAGLSAAALFIIASLAGCVTFLAKHDTQAFLDLLETIGLFAGSCLGLGIFDRFAKPKEPESKTAAK